MTTPSRSPARDEHVIALLRGLVHSTEKHVSELRVDYNAVLLDIQSLHYPINSFYASDGLHPDMRVALDRLEMAASRVSALILRIAADQT